ncbi:MAG: right-handed parallel beta-helix repeat-containing protein [Candidatus Bipolaricaulota bacterium]|nr:right-handed parallel beta-helix repeat-containing protein [Candidatus Bipolaricaulota bacterium]
MRTLWRVAGAVALGSVLAWGATWTVCPEGCAHSSIQEAIAEADPGDTVLIGPGTYEGDLWIRKPLDLRARGDGPVVIAGRIQVLGTHQVTLQGITVRGGGIELGDSTGVLIQGCTVEGPGGVIVRTSSVTLRGLEVTGVAGHGVLVTLGSRALILDSRVVNATGDGIHVAASAADLRNCEAHENGGFGIWGDPHATVSGQTTPAAVTGNGRGTLGGTARALDQDAPAAPAGLTASPATWTSGSVTIAWTPPPDLTGVVAAWYKVGSRPGGPDDGVRTTANPFPLASPPEGRNTVYVWLEDGAGNRSERNFAEVEIACDRTPPTARVSPAEGNRHVFSPQITLKVEATDSAGNGPGSGVAQLRLSNDGKTWGPWQPAAERVSWDLTQAGGSAVPGPRTVHLEVRDGAGNVAKTTAEVVLVRSLALGEPILALAYTADGSQLLLGHPSGKIAVVDVRTGQEVGALVGHTGGGYGLALSPDGKTLASGSLDNTVRLWSLATRKETRVLRGHTGGVWAVAFSPDGKTLASASTDGTVRLWEAATGKLVRTLSGHTGPVRAVAFSPDGKTLATGGDDRLAQLWDVGTGKSKGVLTEHTASVRSVAFSPDGKVLLSVGLDGKVALWDPGARKLLRSLSFQGGLRAVAPAPGGKAVAVAGTAGRITILDWTGAELEVLLGPAQVNALAYAPDGKTLAAGGEDKAARLWEPGR